MMGCSNLLSMNMMKNWIRGLLTGLLGCVVSATHALTPQLAMDMAVGESDSRIQAIGLALESADANTANFLQAMADDAVKVFAGAVWVVEGGQIRNAVTGESRPMPDDAQEVMLNNRMRAEIDTALAALKLFNSDALQRRLAAQTMLKEPDAQRKSMLAKALVNETDAEVQTWMRLAMAAVDISDALAATRMEAVHVLSSSATPEVLLLLNQQLGAEQDPAVQASLKAAIRKVQDDLKWGERLGVLFTGISLGSILMLVALGLAITYGLMGVINMAHGELMMIGAYATYMVQLLFRQYFPSGFDLYLIAAIPASFLASALVGAALERSVLRHLYGRPLETLLATWGISLILMQLVRSVFGAQNVGVENPTWMSGSWEILSNLQLPWNRILIVAFSLVVLSGVALLIGRTRLGLFVRGVTQNRAMASCMGVNTARIDTYAFALGSGIAGLAGCALSQIGNVGPDLGQSYIVDSFMVVVLGGVGQLAGTVYAALGLGLLNKVLEGWAGAVLAKIAVLVFIIVFIQKRPQGIFAMKGRSAEA
jgi:urea transport system permease protein